MAEDSSTPGLGRELDFWHLVMFGIVYMAPIAGFTLYGWVALNSNGAAVPAYLLGAVALALTANSYGVMGEVAPSAGSAFTYVGVAFGSFFGFVAGWAVILDYLLIGALVALYAAIFLNAALPAVPVQAWLAAFLLFSTSTNLLGIRWSMSVDIAIAGIQFVFIAVFVWLATGLIARGGLEPVALWPANVPLSRVAFGAASAVISYLGFDAVMTLTEEVRGMAPGRTAGRAALTAIAVMMAVFVVVTWTLSMLGQNEPIADPSSVSFVILAERLPQLIWPLSLVAALALGFGALVTVHAGVSRIIFGMARDGQLPAMFSLVHPKSRVPWVATLVSMLVMAIAAYVALPQVDLLSGLVSFGALASFILVNASVIGYFGVRRHSTNLLKHWLLPGAGVLTVGYVLTSVLPAALELGGAWLAGGIMFYLAQRALRPARVGG